MGLTVLQQTLLKFLLQFVGGVLLTLLGAQWMFAYVIWRSYPILTIEFWIGIDGAFLFAIAQVYGVMRSYSTFDKLTELIDAKRKAR